MPAGHAAVDEGTLGLIIALANAATSSEALATELTDASVVLDGEPSAELMRSLARSHRVEALKLRCQLAGMKARYEARCQTP